MFFHFVIMSFNFSLALHVQFRMCIHTYDSCEALV